MSTALEKSIAHWQRIVDYVEADYRDGLEKEGYGASSCALCAVHPKCKGCPVKERTGEPGCEKTPYVKAAWALSVWRDSGENEDRENAESAATKELELLKSLRDN